MAFSEDEKSRILTALGYPKFGDVGAAIAFGHPSAGPASDIVYDAFRRLDVHGEARVREDLAEIACIERELSKLRSKASLVRTGDVTFDPRAARRMLMADLHRYTAKLAQDLGAPANPLSRVGGGRRVVNMP